MPRIFFPKTISVWGNSTFRVCMAEALSTCAPSSVQWVQHVPQKGGGEKLRIMYDFVEAQRLGLRVLTVLYSVNFMLWQSNLNKQLR